MRKPSPAARVRAWSMRLAAMSMPLTRPPRRAAMTARFPVPQATSRTCESAGMGSCAMNSSATFSMVRSLGAWASLTVGQGRRIEPFLEHTTEMGDVLEAAFKRDFRDVHLRGAKQRGGIIETFSKQPFAGGFLKAGLEITLEGRKAAVTQSGIFFERQIEAKICLHDFHH